MLRFMHESARQTGKVRKCSYQICGSTLAGADGTCLRSTLITVCREPKNRGLNVEVPPVGIGHKTIQLSIPCDRFSKLPPRKQL